MGVLASDDPQSKKMMQHVVDNEVSTLQDGSKEESGGDGDSGNMSGSSPRGGGNITNSSSRSNNSSSNSSTSSGDTQDLVSSPSRDTKLSGPDVVSQSGTTTGEDEMKEDRKQPPPAAVAPVTPSRTVVADGINVKKKSSMARRGGDQVVALEPANLTKLSEYGRPASVTFDEEPPSPAAVVSSSSFASSVESDDAELDGVSRVDSVRASHRSSRRTRKADDLKKDYLLDLTSPKSSSFASSSTGSTMTSVLLEPATSVGAFASGGSPVASGGALNTLRRQEQELLKQHKVSGRTPSSMTAVSMADGSVTALKGELDSKPGSSATSTVDRIPSTTVAPGAYRITSMVREAGASRDEGDMDDEETGLSPTRTGVKTMGLLPENAFPSLLQESAPDEKGGTVAGGGGGGNGLLHAQAIDEADLEAEFKDRFIKDVTVEATEVKHFEIGDDEEMEEMKRIAARNRVMRNRMCMLLVLVVALAVGLGVGLGSNNTVPTDPPTPAPTLTPYGALRELVSPYSTDAALDDETSPQAMALDWLLNDDPAQLLTTQQEFNASIVLERYVMVVLYYSTDGPNWAESLDFLSVADVCDWPGENSTNSSSDVNRVDCKDGLVNDLRIQFNGLNGTIPAELSALSFLEILSLSHNALYGTIPSELGELSLLHWLQLDANLLTGPIPEDVAALTSLETINMFGNSLSGTIPPTLWDGPVYGLEICDLGSNNFEGTLPPIREQSPIRVWWIDNNNFTGTLPPSMFAQPDLETLGLSENSLSGIFGQQVTGWTKLKEAYFDGNQFSGSIPSKFSGLEALTALNLKDNAFVGTIPPALSGMEKLEILDMSGNQLTGTLAKSLGSFKSLKNWNLDSNVDLRGSVPSSFGLMTSLRSFSLVGTSIDSGVQEAFCSQPSLFTAIAADCSGEVPGIECSCCTSCCDSSASDAELASSCAVNINATCLVKAGPYELDEERNANCTCSADGKSEVVLSCSDTTCETCNLDKSMCAVNTDYGYTLNETTGDVIGFGNTLVYTKGKWTGMRLTYFDRPDETDECDFYVNGQKCDKCYASDCASGFEGFQVVCDNLEGVKDADGVVLGGYSFNNCVRGEKDPGYLAILETHEPAHLAGCSPQLEILKPEETA